jgi:hypothetical protein
MPPNEVRNELASSMEKQERDQGGVELMTLPPIFFIKFLKLAA